MGKQVNWRNQYARISIFQRAKFWLVVKIKQAIKVLAIGGIAGGMIYLAFMAGFSAQPIHVKAEISEQDNLPIKIESLKNKLADIVHKGESDRRKMKDGEIFSVFDPSSDMKAQCMKAYSVRPLDCESYGPYQEKIGTIMHYAKQVYGKELNQMEAMVIANSEEKAKDFFIQCSIKVQGCAWNWTAAKNRQTEVQMLIDTIRDLEK